LSRDFDTVLGDITGKVGAAAAVAVSNPNVAAGDNTLYTSSFHSGKWTGDLIAYNINTSTGLPDLVNPVWTNGCTTSQDTSWIDDNDHSRGKRGCSAQLQLDNTGVVTPTTRKIVTYTGTAGTGQGLQFQPNSATTTTKLSATQQTALNTSATVTDGTNVLSFVRGDRSREGTNYRVRGSRLGDIVNAEPVVINPPSRRYGDAGYTAFKTAKASRRRVVFQAANDGMLHAFDADRTVPGSGGDELWAYVPNIIINNIKGLSTKTGFAHRYYIDATPVIRDVNFNNTDGASGTTADWRTILVGGLGKGGRGYYALDVTDPTAATEAAAISKVLWEFPNSATSNSDKVDIGFSFGRPIITKTKAKGWVALVTSGYNNGADTGGDGKGHLFVLNARTGAVIKDIVTTAGSSATPSGLASISAFVLNASADNTVEYVYGGDLEGNVWRFNLTGDAISDWAATRLTTLVDSAGTAQSITTAPELAIVNVGSAKKRIVLVATGKFLSEKDIPGAAGVLASATQTQSVYGLIDNLTATPTISPLRSNLVQQTLTNVPRPSPLPANYVDKRAASNNSVDLSDATGAKKGWYIDLPTTAERVNTDPTLVAGTLVFTSNIPRLGECSPEGKSWLNFVNYATGGLVPGANFSSWDLGDYLSSRPVVFRIAPTATLGAPSLGNDGVGALTVDSTGRISVKDIPVDNTLPVGRRIGWQEVYE
jgi:type IV pilus assembly protein PilY1